MFVAITALIVDHKRDFVVLFAQGRVILCLFVPSCKHSSIEAVAQVAQKPM